MSIKDIIKALKPNDRKALMDAFDSITPYCVHLDDGHFIGVHVDNMDPKPEVIERAGFFIYGRKA